MVPTMLPLPRLNLTPDEIHQRCRRLEAAGMVKRTKAGGVVRNPLVKNARLRRALLGSLVHRASVPLALGTRLLMRARVPPAEEPGAAQDASHGE